MFILTERRNLYIYIELPEGLPTLKIKKGAFIANPGSYVMLRGNIRFSVVLGVHMDAKVFFVLSYQHKESDFSFQIYTQRLKFNSDTRRSMVGFIQEN